VAFPVAAARCLRTVEVRDLQKRRGIRALPVVVLSSPFSTCPTNLLHSSHVSSRWLPPSSLFLFSVIVPPPEIATPCDDTSGCKIKLTDTRDSCWGTVWVPCGDFLEFYFDANGQYNYQVISRRRRRRRRLVMKAEAVETAEEEEDALPSLSSLITSDRAVADAASSSLGDAAVNGINTSTSSGLRGGGATKGLER
jgi:hypothetical protein